MEKQITLKNNLKLTLNCNVSAEGFYINAVYNNKSVGMCQFHIFNVFAQKMTKKKQEMYAKMHKIPLVNCPKNLELQIDVFGSDNKVKTLFPTDDIVEFQNPDYTIEENVLTFNSGGKYNYSHTICELIRIEILDEQFSHIGLGYEMLKFMEEIANEFNAEKIQALFMPNGNLFHASMQFYKRNGFTFTKRNDKLLYLEKTLQKTNKKDLD